MIDYTIFYDVIVHAVDITKDEKTGQVDEFHLRNKLRRFGLKPEEIDLSLENAVKEGVICSTMEEDCDSFGFNLQSPRYFNKPGKGSELNIHYNYLLEETFPLRSLDSVFKRG